MRTRGTGPHRSECNRPSLATVRMTLSGFGPRSRVNMPDPLSLLRSQHGSNSRLGSGDAPSSKLP